MSELSLTPSDAPMCALFFCVGAHRGGLGGQVLLVSQTHCCCVGGCARRLDKVTAHRPHAGGRACYPRCPKHLLKRTSAEKDEQTDATVPPVRPLKRVRASSDPGEQPAVQAAAAATVHSQRHATSQRVPAPHPAHTSEKRSTRQEARIARLLEETHARRMAALASATASSAMPR